MPFYNYLCNQCLSPLKWVRTPLRWGVLDTTLSDKVCQWFAAGRWFSPGTPVSSINKTNRHDITEILLKVALNTTNLTCIVLVTYLLEKCLLYNCHKLYCLMTIQILNLNLNLVIIPVSPYLNSGQKLSAFVPWFTFYFWYQSAFVNQLFHVTFRFSCFTFHHDLHEASHCLLIGNCATIWS